MMNHVSVVCWLVNTTLYVLNKLSCLCIGIVSPSGNVVWLDNLSAIRALLGISKPIKNLDKLREQEPNKEISPSKVKKEKEDDKSGEDSDVIMIEDQSETAMKQSAKVCC